ncbi:hypothetical protein RI367_001295 [Sorochytrium milnesiophthora]
MADAAAATTVKKESRSCQCNKIAAHFQVKKEGPNKGSWFWTCLGRKCRFFEWDGDKPVASGKTGESSGPSTSTDQKPPTFKVTATFFVLDDQHIAVRYSMIHPNVREMKLREEPPERIRFDICELPDMVTKSEEKLHKRMVNLDDAISEATANMAERLPTDLQEALMPFQREGVRQALAVCMYYQQEWPCLVICPSSLRLTWASEIEKWLHIPELGRMSKRQVTKMQQLSQSDPATSGKRKRPTPTSESEASSETELETDDAAEVKVEEESQVIELDSDGEYVEPVRGRTRAQPRARKRQRTVTAESVTATDEDVTEAKPKGGVQVIKTGKDLIRPDASFVIVSYDLAARIYNELSGAKFKIVVADESHFLKNRETKRTSAILPLLKKAQRAILLSGTPSMNRPFELFTQMQALCPDIFLNAHDFGLRYCSAYYGKYGWDYTGSSLLTELNWMLNAVGLVRRLKKDVLRDLPPKLRSTIDIEVSKKDIDNISSMLDKQKAINELLAEKQTKERRQKLAREKNGYTMAMWHATGVAKVAAVQEYLRDLLHSTDKKVIVFAYHTIVIDGVAEYMDSHAKDLKQYIRIDGKTPLTQRQALCDRFQTDENVRVAILSMTAAGTGLTLNQADVVVFAELHWVPSLLLQCEDRAHRIGRVGPVDIKYILARNTMDSMQWPSLKRKLAVVKSSLDGAGDASEFNDAAKEHLSNDLRKRIRDQHKRRLRQRRAAQAAQSQGYVDAGHDDMYEDYDDDGFYEYDYGYEDEDGYSDVDDEDYDDDDEEDGVGLPPQLSDPAASSAPTKLEPTPPCAPDSELTNAVVSATALAPKLESTPKVEPDIPVAPKPEHM